MSGAIADRPAVNDGLEFARIGRHIAFVEGRPPAGSMKQLIEAIGTLRLRGTGFAA
jgi:hypothetical protein